MSRKSNSGQRHSLTQLEILHLFCRRADEIAGSSIYKNGPSQISLKIVGSPEGQINVDSIYPNKEALIAIVTQIRQFCSPREPICFGRVYNIVMNHLSAADSDDIKCAKSAMDGYKSITEKAWIGIEFNRRKLMPKDILDIWYNGMIFHSDPTKIRRFDQLFNSPVGRFAEFQFASTVCSLASLIIYFASFITERILKNLEAH